MIVKNVKTGWEIIMQRSHGLLAGQIAHALSDLNGIKYRLETLLAIIEHDDYKEDFGGNRYLTDAGAPKDFTLFDMHDKSRYVEAVRRVENQTLRHRWIGLLQSRHVHELYDGEKVSKELKAFLKSEKKRRKEVLKELDTSLEELENAYQCLGWADRCSLILCRDQIPAMGRHLEIITVRDGTRYEIAQRDDETLDVSPWPFQTQRFEVCLESHLLTQLSFKSDEALYQSLRQSQTKTQTWTFKQANRD